MFLFRLIYDWHVYHCFNYHQSILPWKNRTNDKHTANGLGGSIPPIAVGWRLDEFSVHTALVIYNSHVEHAEDCIGIKSIRKPEKQKAR